MTVKIVKLFVGKKGLEYWVESSISHPDPKKEVEI